MHVDDNSSQHALILVTKIPMLASSKTRLQRTLGAEAALEIARSMLLDILTMNANKESALYSLLNDAGIPTVTQLWRMMPMLERGHDGLLSVDLSDKLKHIVYGDEMLVYKSITLIGSDCPQLPTEEIYIGQSVAEGGEAYICPASDGGYVLLTLPSRIPPGAFDDVLWSNPSTLVSQVEALRRLGLTVRIGRTYRDVDTFEDALALLQADTRNYTLGKACCIRTIASIQKFY